jgi:transcriptional regulator with XRE-family HTH domain
MAYELPKGGTSLRNAIRDAESRGITRYRIAKVSGVDETNLSRIMAGQIVPRMDTAERIAAALGCSIQLVAAT